MIRSLRRDLMLGIGAAAIAIFACAGVAVFILARASLLSAFDSATYAKAQVVGSLVELHHGEITVEELLQQQEVPAIAQRILREQPHLGQAVEHHPPRFDALDLVPDQLDGPAELHLPAVQDRLVPARAQDLVRGAQFEDVDAVHAPTVRACDDLQLFLRFR